MKKILYLLTVIVLAFAILFTSCEKSDPVASDIDKVYDEALDMINSGKYEEAYTKLLSIKDKKDVSEYLDRFTWVLVKEDYTNHSGEYTSVIKYEYDENGNITKTTESDSRNIENVTSYTYKNGLLSETSKWTVETNDNLISQYIYTNDGILDTVIVWSSYENAEYQITYEYNEAGQLVKLTNNNFYNEFIEEYSYDDNGRLLQSVYKGGFSSATTKYEYDENGLLVKQSTNYYDGDGYITYNYDAYGNLILETNHLGANTKYSYKLIYREENEPKEQYGFISVIADYNPNWISWSNGKITAIEHEGKYIFIDNIGKTVAGPFDGAMCPDSSGFLVGFSHTSEVVGTDKDSNDLVVDVKKKTTKSYIFDSFGNLIFETVGSRTDYVYESIYEGEYLKYCTEGRIITVSYDDYYIGLARNSFTVNIYDMSGNKIAEHENIFEVGTYINGKLIMVDYAGLVTVVDRHGKIVACADNLSEQHPNFNKEYFGMYYPYVTDGHYMAYFTNGYVIIEVEPYSGSDDLYHLLISEDMTKSYLIKKEYLYNNRNYGTLVFSKIVENGAVSNGYYLIDASKCGVDEKGMIIPTRSAAVYDKEFASGSFYNIFGENEKYALVSTSDDKWGFLSYDGKTHKMYDDASYFSGGIAIVKDGNDIYVIDENFKRISDVITGYDSVSVAGNGVFVLKKGDQSSIAVFTK
ncbi:MAG: hypothetical protein IKM18_07105 [Clostridia bacterium]|nr:hypothetical protein [Clostridia bacterium]